VRRSKATDPPGAAARSSITPSTAPTPAAAQEFTSIRDNNPVSWHFFFESLAYAVAFRIYLAERRNAGDFLDTQTRWNIVIAAIAGAASGSKVLYWFENPAYTAAHWKDVAYLLAGKTMVGALAGGTIAVELAKLRTGLRRRTGDLFAIPLCIGIAIGRIGCYLAGKRDDTYGIPTTLPWGLDLGDGVRRHPVQLYELGAMLLLAVLLARIKQPRFAEGDRFRAFVLAYYGWRLAVDFLKPGIRFEGLTILQWVCVAGLLWYTPDLWRMACTASTPSKQEALAHG
jgi:phosphatidylglycerol:prolipoprotein diacylglycerol transferase